MEEVQKIEVRCQEEDGTVKCVRGVQVNSVEETCNAGEPEETGIPFNLSDHNYHMVRLCLVYTGDITICGVLPVFSTNSVVMLRHLPLPIFL